MNLFLSYVLQMFFGNIIILICSTSIWNMILHHSFILLFFCLYIYFIIINICVYFWSHTFCVLILVFLFCVLNLDLNLSFHCLCLIIFMPITLDYYIIFENIKIFIILFSKRKKIWKYIISWNESLNFN
jgi:hypothetical protein